MDPRLYSGEFPPGGPHTADALVTALAESVTRVREKYGAAIQMLATTRGISVSEALDLVDDDWSNATTEQRAAAARP